MSLFTVEGEAGDVEEVMREVSAGLRRWESGTSPMPDILLPGGIAPLTPQARMLRLHWNIDGNAIIHSTRPLVGVWLIRFQLLVRRLSWWFLEPILQQIRRFQANTARVADGLAQGQESLAGRMAELEAELAQLRARVGELEERERDEA